MPVGEYRWIRELAEGEEISWLFHSDADFYKGLTVYLEEGLTRREKIIFAGQGGWVQKLEKYLNRSGPKFSAAISSKEIDPVDLSTNAPAGGTLEPQELIRILGGCMDSARREGFAGVRLVVDVGGVLGSAGNTDRRLLGLEQQLKQFVHQRSCTGLWVYDARKLSYGVLLILITTRPRVGVGSHVFKPAAFINPEEFLGFRHTALPGYRWLSNAVTRNEAEELLGKGDRWFRSIFDQVSQFVGVVDRDGILLEVNQPGLDYGGVTRAEVIGRPLWEGAWWADNPQAQEELQKAIQRAAQGEYVRFELGASRDQDQTYIFDFSLRPVRSEDGEVSLLIADGRDITDERQDEHRLLEREKLIEATLAGSPIVLMMVDSEGIIRVLSGRGRESLVRDENAYIGHSIHEAYSSRPDVVEHIERAMRGESFIATIERDGLVFTTHYSPFTNETGQPAGAIAVATNITPQKEALKALQSSEARLQTIFAESRIGIVLKDMDGRVIDSNPAFQRMLGYTGNELRNKTFIDLTHPGDLMDILPFYNELFNGQRSNFELEKRYLRKDGRVAWGHIAASLVRLPDGKPYAGLIMVEDVTEKIQMEAELQEVHRRLAQAQDTERQELAQDLHDGPLQELYAISYQLRAIDVDDSPETMASQLSQVDARIQEQIQTLRALCGELRPPTLAPFGLAKAIRSHAEDFQQAHPKIKLQLDLMPDGKSLPEKVRLALFRIYQELLNNVIRHSEANHVTVRFHMNDEQVILEVEDDGKGFTVPKRWVELAREGHLGLVGVLERVETIGGRLKVSSQPGRGTTIQIRVPRIFKEDMWAVGDSVREGWR